jgi:nanoRNase/pAp phosphatase (c-di-AMP/oligoRNAs hydrolase)
MTQLQAERFRLVTRSDFDGLVCAALLKHLDMLDDVKFVHPKDVQDGKVELGSGDITTNLPYHPGVHIAFDHHHSETLRVEGRPANHVIVPGAESAARVVYEHFGAADTFGGIEEQQNTVFATGKSIIDRGSRTNVGELMLEYGGGGHEAAGTCQVENADAERVLGELIGRITADG